LTELLADNFRKEFFEFLESFTVNGINDKYIESLLDVAERESFTHGDRAMLKANEMRQKLETVRETCKEKK
jgi:hypothetical protein